MKCPACGAKGDGERCGGCARVLPDRSPGDTIGQHEIITLVGQGAQSCVYEAKHRTHGKREAIKILAGSAAAHPEQLRRFFGEARLATRAKHENVVAVVEVFETERYYAMELLDGKTLRQSLAGPMPLRRAVGIGAQLASALLAVHDAGIVHGAVSPEAMMLVRDQVKLIHFSHAAEAGRWSEAGPSDPRYLAPEAFARLQASRLLDVYAFGVVLYELLAGRRPFDAASLDEWKSLHGRGDAPDIAALASAPQPVVDLVRRCLAKKPAERPGDLAEIDVSLRQCGVWLDLENPRPLAPAMEQRAPSTSKRGRVAVAVSAVAILGAAATVALWPKEPAPVPVAPAPAPDPARTAEPASAPAPVPAAAPTAEPAIVAAPEKPPAEQLPLPPKKALKQKKPKKKRR